MKSRRSLLRFKHINNSVGIHVVHGVFSLLNPDTEMWVGLPLLSCHSRAAA